jgi:hypothetical protein
MVQPAHSTYSYRSTDLCIFFCSALSAYLDSSRQELSGGMWNSVRRCFLSELWRINLYDCLVAPCPGQVCPTASV